MLLPVVTCNLAQDSARKGFDVSCSTSLPKSPDRIAQPHSRSGPRPCPWVPVASSPLITGARLAFALLYRSLLLSMNPYPSLHRLAITRLGAASLLLNCLSAAVYPFSFHISRLQKRQSPDVSVRAFLFFMPPLKVKAAYQSMLKYDVFNLLLQYSAAKMSIFVPNVFLLR